MHAFGATGACGAVRRIRCCSIALLPSSLPLPFLQRVGDCVTCVLCPLPDVGPNSGGSFRHKQRRSGFLRLSAPSGRVTCAPRLTLSVQEQAAPCDHRQNFAEDNPDLEKQLEHAGDHLCHVCHGRLIREAFTAVCSALSGNFIAFTVRDTAWHPREIRQATSSGGI